MARTLQSRIAEEKALLALCWAVGHALPLACDAAELVPEALVLRRVQDLPSVEALVEATRWVRCAVRRASLATPDLGPRKLIAYATVVEAGRAFVAVAALTLQIVSEPMTDAQYTVALAKIRALTSDGAVLITQVCADRELDFVASGNVPAWHVAKMAENIVYGAQDQARLLAV